jgi:hypothetical protein
LADAVHERDTAVRVKAEIDAALGRSESAGHYGDANLDIIRAYAYKKNQRGVIKKATSFVGGLLGIGAGIASLVASIALATGAAAGAAVLMATPVGWGLAGAAAAVGIGLGLYKAVRFFSKRWAQSGQLKDQHGRALSTGARLKKTLAFWRPVGKSRRESYAEALWKMAKDGAQPVRQREAKELIKSLGLDFDALGMGSDKDDAVKLLMAKMAS